MSFDEIMTAAAPVLANAIGDTVTYTHYDEDGTVSSGFPASVALVSFRESSRDRRDYDDGQGDVYEAEVGIDMSDLGDVAPTVNLDKFTRDGIVWVCRTIQDTAGGIANCRFGRFVNKERSAPGYRRAR